MAHNDITGIMKSTKSEPHRKSYGNGHPRGYLPIESYGIIGNMRTAALCGIDGSIDFMCYPEFDSPSIFCRILDDKKGGHFSITPCISTTKKQQYLLNTNILVTRFLSHVGVVQVTDYMPRTQKQRRKPLYPWLVRQVEAVRGSMRIHIECVPSFNYARDRHTTELVRDRNISQGDDIHTEQDRRYKTSEWKLLFTSEKLKLDLRWITRATDDGHMPELNWKIVEPADCKDEQGNTWCEALGPVAVAELTMYEGQQIIMILREPVEPSVSNGYKEEETEHASTTTQCKLLDPVLSYTLIGDIFEDTKTYWHKWITQSQYKGRWRETVERSALLLKLLVYEPTGAIIAAPTFSLPEAIGGERNWDYRYTWVRDTSFTIYALIRLGLVDEAEAYMKFMEGCFANSNPDGSLQIMYGIRGETELKEIELSHLDGYRGSKPVRIGNGAYNHIQLDIYGELLDAAYLFNKHGPPISYDMWCSLRKLVNYVCANWKRPDMSIWEVRSEKRNFLYSKIMCWVAVDRGIRLAEKRIFPCPDRDHWLRVRDEIYETIQTYGYNKELGFFSQAFESPNIVDASVLIMPMVFFSSPTDPRLLNTIHRILQPLEKGGLTTNSLVYRYNTMQVCDGLRGEEGCDGTNSFTLCCFWLIEALTRAGVYRPELLTKALMMFQQMIGYGNHLSLFSEEIAPGGELLGNFPQAFSHISIISAAFNLDRALNRRKHI